MEQITAVIITCNEERNIGRCIESLGGVVDEIVVVDSGSKDRTDEICRGAGVRFEYHEWAGYAEQKNYADSLATNAWILSIDADEALSEGLKNSLLQFKESSPDDNTIYYFNRMTNYCGRWIRHCGWYPDPCLRLWHAGVARWDGLVHEELLYAPTVKLQRLEGDLLHYSYYSIEDHANRQLHYATLAAEKAFRQGKRCSMATVALKQWWTFIRNYIFKGGFLDGPEGYMVCRMSACYTFMKYAFLREMHNNASEKQEKGQ